MTGGGPKQPAEPAAQGTASPGAPPRPATADDIRGLRRWLLVAGVWAVAATAIAVIALIKANDANNEQQNAKTASQLTQVQRDLSNRLDGLEKQIDDLAPAADVQRLDQRLKKVEEAASKSNDRLAAVVKDVDDLQKRVDDLEKAAQSGTDTTGTDTTGTDTTQTTP